MRHAIAVLALLGLVACAGITAREEVLMRSMSQAWASIEQDVNRGLDDAIQSAEIGGDISILRVMISEVGPSLKSGDRKRATSALQIWPLLNDLAVRGIDVRVKNNEITQAVADFMYERVRLFTESVNKLGER